MKAGEIVTFAHVEGETLAKVLRRRPLERHAVMCNEHAFTHFGTHSDEEWAKTDAADPIVNGTAEYIVVCKVIAVVRRSIKVEE